MKTKNAKIGMLVKSKQNALGVIYIITGIDKEGERLTVSPKAKEYRDLVYTGRASIFAPFKQEGGLF